MGMSSLSADQIRDIAQDLDCGFICYVNVETGEHVTIPKDYDLYDVKAFDEEVKLVKKHRKNYREIEPPMSGESFRIMKNFIYSLPETAHELKAKLVKAMNMHKPFHNFKNVIDDSGEYRDQWFAFKNQRLIEFVK